MYKILYLPTAEELKVYHSLKHRVIRTLSPKKSNISLRMPNLPDENKTYPEIMFKVIYFGSISKAYEWITEVMERAELVGTHLLREHFEIIKVKK
jgi:hypothetical protein